MIGRRILYLGALAGCLVFYFCYQQWLSWLLLLAVVILPWLSLLLSLPAMIQFRAEIELPRHAQKGDEIHADLWGLSHLPQPHFLCKIFREDLLTGETARHHTRHPMPTAKCGGVKLEVKKLRICDYLGLFALPVRSPEAKIMVVRPESIPMEELPDLTHNIPRAWKPKHGGGFAENHELRLYRPGDSLNQVHWKLSAKTGELILREPMEPIRERLVLTMDLSGDIDRKCGQLLWLSRNLLAQDLAHEIRCLTADGVIIHDVTNENELMTAMDDLLCHPMAPGGTLRDRVTGAVWQYHIGGDADEA